MHSISWYNSDTLRTSLESTGNLRIESRGVEITIEILGDFTVAPTADFVLQAARTILEEVIAARNPVRTFVEPESEPPAN